MGLQIMVVWSIMSVQCLQDIHMGEHFLHPHFFKKKMILFASWLKMVISVPTLWHFSFQICSSETWATNIFLTPVRRDRSCHIPFSYIAPVHLFPWWFNKWGTANNCICKIGNRFRKYLFIQYTKLSYWKKNKIKESKSTICFMQSLDVSMRNSVYIF